MADEIVIQANDLFGAVSFGGGGSSSSSDSKTKSKSKTSTVKHASNNNKSHMGRVGSLSNAEGKNVTKSSVNPNVDRTVGHIAVQLPTSGISGCVSCHLDPMTRKR